MNDICRQIQALIDFSEVLMHEPCGSLVRMGEYRVIFCPKCGWSKTGTIPKWVFCCVECKKPLEVTQGGGNYCIRCKFHPSMQDLELQEVSKMTVRTIGAACSAHR